MRDPLNAHAAWVHAESQTEDHVALRYLTLSRFVRGAEGMSKDKF